MATYVMMAKSKSHHYPYHQHLPLISRIAVHYKYLLLISRICTRKKGLTELNLSLITPEHLYTLDSLFTPFHPIMMCYSYNKCWTFQFVEQSWISKVFFYNNNSRLSNVKRWKYLYSVCNGELY